MAIKVKLSNILPRADSDDNGLVDIADRLYESKGVVYAIVQLKELRSGKERRGEKDLITTQYVVGIEPMVEDEHLKQAFELFEQAKTVRTGLAPLPGM